MQDIFVSVIVPVYNVEKYLKECVDSILGQSWQNYEMILVDDGSTDSSGKICDDYALKNKKIKVVHKKNGGLSSARNSGIDIAKGNYIAFVDSDDVLHTDYLKVMIELIKKESADLVACDFVKGMNCCWEKNIEQQLDIRCGDDVLDQMNNNDVIVTVAWNKLYDKKFFQDYQLRYPEGKIHEDMFLTPQILHLAKKMVITNQKLYFYRQRENSIMNSKFSKKQLDILEAIEFRITLLNKWNKTELLVREYESYIRKCKELYQKMQKDDSQVYQKACDKIEAKIKEISKNPIIFNELNWKYKIKLILFLVFKR
ncbi:glycosyltransferase family 2 protein [Brotaphodocola sp.]|uniref:glycosyltransferase family 2 protein n=1 Tax=Brotaphodocola sp. TaxID=3073577 RepID=UPI003D7CE8E9